MDNVSQNVAPWLQGLDDDSEWGAPIEVVPTITANCVSSASHDASSLRSRIPVRNTSGSFKSSSHAKSHGRHPLASLSSNNSDSIRRPRDSLKLSQSRSFSGASDGSVVQYNTVQQRCKSVSPLKQETLEWKKRLVNGEVGYGDQTDLFGATGLENIFLQNPSAENTKVQRTRTGWLKKSAQIEMPSSPPLWPRKTNESGIVEEEEHTYDEDGLPKVDEEQLSAFNLPQTESSFRSDPYEELSPREHDAPEQDSDGNEQASSPERPQMQTAQENGEGNRTVSGQTDVDDFSPVFVSKHTTMNGLVEYKALDSRVIKQFQNKAVNLMPEGQASPQATEPAEPERSTLGISTFTDGPESELLPAAPDLSLSENLPTGTPPVASLCEGVQVRRGGYSRSGSFRSKLLSPSQSTARHSSTHGPNDLLSPSPSHAAKYPNTLSPPHAPTTPAPNDQSEPRSRSSGSPLKLFGPHDTFTSNRLWRRMSQLDPDLSAIRSENAFELEQDLNHDGKAAGVQRTVSGSSFGNGELDSHAFNAEITITSASDSDKADSDKSPGSEIPPPGSKTPFGFRLEEFPAAHDTFKLKRKLSKRSDERSKDSTLDVPLTRRYVTVEDASGHISRVTTREISSPEAASAAAKRPPNSPFKAPTPKRRRTLHASELEEEVSDVSRSYHAQLQEIISDGKRRESRRGDDHEVASPAVLAQRKILRPRNPTPNHNRREQIEAEIRETAEQFAEEEPEAMEAVLEQIESSMASDSPPSVQQQAKVVASEVAKFSLRIQKASGEHTDRKRSVTTQDFYNEAVMVMRLIREKAGRQSGLGSVAESDQELVHEASGADHSGHDLSSLRVSRPPSREGVSGWRPRTSQQTDPQVISHLRRFEERNDTEFFAESALQHDEPAVVIDEHSNIRIRGPMPTHYGQPEDDPSRPSTQHSQQSSVGSHSTQNSAASSTGRTLLSRKSDNVGTLAPESVAHLIGEQVGAMTYDKDKQQWIKVKSPQKPQYGIFLEPPSNITSDDDPFREISDLAVDQNKEEEIRKSSIMRRTSAQPLQPPNSEERSEEDGQQLETRTTSQETVVARPATGDSNKSRHAYSSSDPSRYTALASSQQQTIETRATSWGNEELERLAARGLAKQQPLAYAAAQAALSLGDRYQYGEAESVLTNRNGPDDETEAEYHINQAVEHSKAFDGLRDDTAVGVADETIEDLSSPKLRQSLPTVQARPMTMHQESTRHVSLRRKTLTSKFNTADMLEQSELSFVAPLPGDRMMSVSLSVSRPLCKRKPVAQVSKLQSSPSRPDPSFMLSDLPDFTVHEEDHERPSERILANRLAQHAAAEVDDRYALAVKDLVKTLTDVKEDEPYWEDLKQLDLHDRSLASIHGLDHFCESVQEIDVSKNKLQYLNGAPTTLRQLVARSNQLSSLTSWTHLVNLQYLDISGNQLHNLEALSCLFHLRELRVDDNALTSLSGIMELDGLLKIRARRNQLKVVDFGQNRLHRLEELDLCGNAMTAIQNVDTLSELRTLKLDNNSLAPSLQLEREMSNLKHVSMKNCGLRHLDARAMPHVRQLLLDGNSLPSIRGAELLRCLDVLSMRQQSLPANEQVTILQNPVHARTIRLSQNNIPTLHLNSSQLSVQDLELASVGLQELPDDFGLLFPNLTTLNLNFNSLKDIRGLLNIQKLERLSVCCNRLDRLRKTVATLSRLTTLNTVDLRENHVTQAFYAPHTYGQAVTSVVCRDSSATEQDQDDETERIEQAQHNLPSGNSEQDQVHQGRLDEDTRLRRRVYHLLLGNSCPTLSQVDGLEFDKKSAQGRDETWQRLLELDIVRKSGAVAMKGDIKTP